MLRRLVNRGSLDESGDKQLTSKSSTIARYNATNAVPSHAVSQIARIVLNVTAHPGALVDTDAQANKKIRTPP